MGRSLWWAANGKIKKEKPQRSSSSDENVERSALRAQATSTSVSRDGASCAPDGTVWRGLHRHKAGARAADNNAADHAQHPNVNDSRATLCIWCEVRRPINAWRRQITSGASPAHSLLCMRAVLGYHRALAPGFDREPQRSAGLLKSVVELPP